MSNTDNNRDLSPNQKAVKRLLKNKPAVAGLILIAFSTIIAILGYLITPDHTEDANDQINEVNLKPPGFKIDLLKVRKNRTFESQSFIKTMLFGKPNPYRLVPITGYDMKDGYLTAQIYQGEGKTPKPEQLSLADIVYPLSSFDESVAMNGGQIGYYPINRQQDSIALNTLKERVISQHIQDIRLPRKGNNFTIGSFPELAGQKKALDTKLLKIRKNTSTQAAVPDSNFVWRAIQAYTIKQDTLIATGWAFGKDSLGNKRQGPEERYSLADIAYSLPPGGGMTTLSNNGNLAFFHNDQPRTMINSSELQTAIEQNHIIKKTFYFGTDGYGRCLLSRLMIGVRISLSVGLIAVLISLTIGIFLGAVAGYMGGKVDDAIMFLINTMWSIPTLLMVFALVLALGRGYWQIFTAVGLTMWVDVARIVRGQVMGLRNVLFVEAATSFGFSNARIIRRHILPNILGPVMVIAAVNFAAAILIEAGLSYLGFGIQPPKPTWGTMLSDNYSFLISGGNPFPALVPAIAIMLLVLAFNLVGNGFRDALDVKTRL